MKKLINILLVVVCWIGKIMSLDLSDPNVVQTEELCMEAVKENGYKLQHVKNQTDAICLEALDGYDHSTIMWMFCDVYKFIKYPSPQLINMLLELYPVHKPVIMNKYAIDLIKNYEAGHCAIAHIGQHANELLYSPNNVYALFSQMRWRNKTNPKTVFLTL